MDAPFRAPGNRKRASPQETPGGKARDELLDRSSEHAAGSRTLTPGSRTLTRRSLARRVRVLAQVVTRPCRTRRRARGPGSRVLRGGERTSTTAAGALPDGRHRGRRTTIRTTPANRDPVPEPRPPHPHQRPAGRRGWYANVVAHPEFVLISGRPLRRTCPARAHLSAIPTPPRPRVSPVTPQRERPEDRPSSEKLDKTDAALAGSSQHTNKMRRSRHA